MNKKKSQIRNYLHLHSQVLVPIDFPMISFVRLIYLKKEFPRKISWRYQLLWPKVEIDQKVQADLTKKEKSNVGNP